MRRILLFLLLLCTSVSANAAENEIKIGLTTATRYNDNIGNVSSGKKSDSFSFDFGPRIDFDSTSARYELGGDYSPRISIYTNRVRNTVEVDHIFATHGEYRPTPRWTLGLRDRLRLETDADRDTDNGAAADLDTGSQQTLRNSISGNVRYGVTPRTSISSNVGYSLTEREDASLIDSSQISGGVQGSYVVGAGDTFSFGGRARRQELTRGSKSNLRDTSTAYYGFYLSWDHRFSPRMGISAGGGPTWVVSKVEGGVVPSETNTDYFANVRIFADFGKGSMEISYSRSSSDFARTSTAYLIDSVDASANWSASRRLVFGLKSGWNKRVAVRKFPGIQFQDAVTQWQAAASVSYQIRRELRGVFTLDFLRQDEQRSKPSDRFRATLRFNYNAKAFRF